MSSNGSRTHVYTASRRRPRLFWIALGLISLILLVTVSFFAGRHRPPVTTGAAEQASGAKSDGPAKVEPGGDAGKLPEAITLSPEARKTAGITVEPVQLAPGGDTLSVPGTIEFNPNKGARVTPPVSGKLVRIMVGLGTSVRAGEPLAVMDSFDIAQAQAAVHQAAAAVQQAQAALPTAAAGIEQARAGVAQAQAGLESARSRERSARIALQRQTALAQTGAFSQPSLQAAQQELSEAQSQLLQSETDLQAHTVVLQRAERLFNEQLIARADMEQAQLDQRQDQAKVERAQQRAALASQALQREQRVFRGDLLTKGAIQGAEADLRAAQADVQKAVQEVFSAQQQVRRSLTEEQAARTTLQGALSSASSARGNLSSLAGAGRLQNLAGQITLYAPISGVITERHATQGEAVERSSTLFVIANLTAVTVEASVPERDVARVHVGESVSVSAAAYPARSFPGVVEGIGSQLDEKTRALPVRCLVENRDGLLKPEMFALVTLASRSATRIPAVPSSAVEEDGPRRYVYVETEGGYARREVRVGPPRGEIIPVLVGLRPGEHVVTQGVFILKSERLKSQLKGDD